MYSHAIIFGILCSLSLTHFSLTRTEKPLSPPFRENHYYKIRKHNRAASKFKQVRRGVKEVVKQLKTTKEGLCVIAGDISPIDVITHVPMLCEEAGVQYVYVHSKEQLGAAGMTKRPTSVMLVLPKAVKGSTKMGKDDEKEFEEMYKSVYSKVKGMHEK